MLLKMFNIKHGCISWSSAMQVLCNTYANNVLFNLLPSEGVSLVATLDENLTVMETFG